MKKRDFILIGTVLVLALLCWLIPRAAGIFAGEEAFPGADHRRGRGVRKHAI